MNFTVRHICKTPLTHDHTTLALLCPQLYSPFRLLSHTTTPHLLCFVHSCILLSDSSHTLPHHTCSSVSTAVFSFQTPLTHDHTTLALLYPQLYSPFRLLSHMTTPHLLFCIHSCILLSDKAVFSFQTPLTHDHTTLALLLSTAVFSFQTPLTHDHTTLALLYPQLYSPFEKKGSGERQVSFLPRPVVWTNECSDKHWLSFPQSGSLSR